MRILVAASMLVHTLSNNDILMKRAGPDLAQPAITSSA
jgi:hypothetical protein